MFKTIEEFYEVNRVLREDSNSINRRSNKLSKDELKVVLDLYLTYLRTPKPFIEEAIIKYKINPSNKKIGTIFLLIVLGTKSFAANDKKWDSKRYGHWAKILTGWIEQGYTYLQAKKQIAEKSKAAIMQLFSNSGVVNESAFKNTMKDFRTIHKAKYGNEYLIYIDNQGHIKELPQRAIDILKIENLI